MFQKTTKRFSYIEVVEFSMVSRFFFFFLFKMCELEITEAHWEFFNHHHLESMNWKCDVIIDH